MRLLFDQNLYPYLKYTFQDLDPQCLHVRDVGLESANDVTVWEYAAGRAFTIVSKDSYFRQLSFTFGHPPKAIWIRRGNCSTSEMEQILRDRYSDLIAFYNEEQGALLALS